MRQLGYRVYWTDHMNRRLLAAGFAAKGDAWAYGAALANRPEVVLVEVLDENKRPPHRIAVLGNKGTTNFQRT